MKYFVYILKSEKTGIYYIGCTNNLSRRVSEHNNNKVKSTKNKGPWELKFKEQHSELSSARKRENEIKRWKKRIKIDKLLQQSMAPSSSAGGGSSSGGQSQIWNIIFIS